jgi:ABC-2 type transport system ATP-binding protein
MSIKVSQLTKVYGTQQALKEVSFTIEKGEITGLLGPNGAGKSTLMKILSCFIPQTQGEAWVEGLNTRESPLEIRRLLGYLPENNPLYPEMYIREYLGFIAGLYKLPKAAQRIGEVVEMTGLTNEINKPIGKLSKGYRQRVGLAQALIHDPRVLILDEPTTGLDPNQIVEIREVIRKAGARKTIILSTHIMREVEAVCTRAIIINKGSIVADDSTSNLARLTRGRILITAEFDREPHQRIQKIPGLAAIKKTGTNKYEIESRDESDIRPAIFQFAVSEGLTVLSLHQEEKSLEQVFQEITRKQTDK